MISHVEPEMESGYRPGEFGWMAPVDGDAHDICRITRWCVRSYLTFIERSIPLKRKAERGATSLCLSKRGHPFIFLGPKIVPHSISVRMQKCSDGSRRGPLVDSIGLLYYCKVQSAASLIYFST